MLAGHLAWPYGWAVLLRFFLAQLAGLGFTHLIAWGGLLVEQDDDLSSTVRLSVIGLWLVAAFGSAMIFSLGLPASWPHRPGGYRRWLTAAMLTVAAGASALSLMLGFGAAVVVFGVLVAPAIAQSLAFHERGMMAAALALLAFIATGLAWSVVSLVDFKAAGTGSVLGWGLFMDVATAGGACAGFALLLRSSRAD